MSTFTEAVERLAEIAPAHGGPYKEPPRWKRGGRFTPDVDLPPDIGEQPPAQVLTYRRRGLLVSIYYNLDPNIAEDLFKYLLPHAEKMLRKAGYAGEMMYDGLTRGVGYDVRVSSKRGKGPEFKTILLLSQEFPFGGKLVNLADAWLRRRRVDITTVRRVPKKYRHGPLWRRFLQWLGMVGESVLELHERACEALSLSNPYPSMGAPAAFADRERTANYSKGTSKAKASKAEVNYRPMESPQSRCGGCVHYKAGGTCLLVAGPIHFNATCDRFQPAGAGAGAKRNETYSTFISPSQLDTIRARSQKARKADPTAVTAYEILMHYVGLRNKALRGQDEAARREFDAWVKGSADGPDLSRAPAAEFKLISTKLAPLVEMLKNRLKELQDLEDMYLEGDGDAVAWIDSMWSGGYAGLKRDIRELKAKVRRAPKQKRTILRWMRDLLQSSPQQRSRPARKIDPRYLPIRPGYMRSKGADDFAQRLKRLGLDASFTACVCRLARLHEAAPHLVAAATAVGRRRRQARQKEQRKAELTKELERTQTELKIARERKDKARISSLEQKRDKLKADKRRIR